jgi:hypothetical protein
VAYNFTLYTNLGNSFSPSWCGFISEVFFMSSVFVIGQFVVVKDSGRLFSTQTRHIGKMLKVIGITECTEDGTVLYGLEGAFPAFLENELRALTPLEEAML